MCLKKVKTISNLEQMEFLNIFYESKSVTKVVYIKKSKHFIINKMDHNLRQGVPQQFEPTSKRLLAR
jgi:hypothetical protein